jgi:hypothetical protein
LLLLAATTAMLLLACLVAGRSGAEEERGMPLQAERAFGYLTEICRLGPRFSGSSGMEAQQKLIAEHFSKFGAQVRFQPFDAAHPQTGRPVRMNNIIVSWHPKATERVLLACHYDTRPTPDREPAAAARGAAFLGANDGASGVALAMEMAHHMAELKPTYGVDFAFFDGEELVYGRQGTYFLGSEHFAMQYRDRPPVHRYVYGVVVDMVADRSLDIFMERNSLKYAPELTKSIWETARRLNVTEFKQKAKHEIQDDHLPLNDVAKIPTCDIIDFDYPAWHTTRDVPANCSGASLVKVGRVLLEWLTQVPQPGKK